MARWLSSTATKYGSTTVIRQLCIFLASPSHSSHRSRSCDSYLCRPGLVVTSQLAIDWNGLAFSIPAPINGHGKCRLDGWRFPHWVYPITLCSTPSVGARFSLLTVVNGHCPTWSHTWQISPHRELPLESAIEKHNRHSAIRCLQFKHRLPEHHRSTKFSTLAREVQRTSYLSFLPKSTRAYR